MILPSIIAVFHYNDKQEINNSIIEQNMAPSIFELVRYLKLGVQF